VNEDPRREPERTHGSHPVLIVAAFGLALMATGSVAILLIELFEAIGWWRPLRDP